MLCNIYGMKRTTVFLEERLLRKLRLAARRKGVSAAMLVREALEEYLAGPVARASVPGIAGRFASGTADTSARVDELLWQDPHR
jgi:hypothetical protein